MAKRARAGDLTVAVAYIRRSKSKQALSPEAQRATIEAYCAARGMRLVAVHVDSLTGATPLDQRPAFTAALGAMRELGAGAMVVSDRTRIARDVVVSALAERAAVAAGGRLVSADGAANGASAADEFMRGVLASASQYERAMIRKRTCDGLAVKRAKTQKTGGDVPYGFRAEGDEKTLVPEPAEQAVIARAHALRGEGDDARSFGWVARQLAAEGHTPRTGGAWHEMQVRRMFAAKAA